MIDAVTRYFPPGCKLSRPQGGYMLWIELPRHVDSRKVFELARSEHIGLAPGATFSCAAASTTSSASTTASRGRRGSMPI